MCLFGLGGVELVVDVFLSAHRFIIINNKHPSLKHPQEGPLAFGLWGYAARLISGEIIIFDSSITMKKASSTSTLFHKNISHF
jgi:hypothetical protein